MFNLHVHTSMFFLFFEFFLFSIHFVSFFFSFFFLMDSNNDVKEGFFFKTFILIKLKLKSQI